MFPENARRKEIRAARGGVPWKIKAENILLALVMGSDIGNLKTEGLFKRDAL